MSRSRFEKYPKTTMAVFLGVFLALSILAVEIILAKFFPIALSNVGFVGTPNGFRFGWGFNPYGLVRIEDPDTGKVSQDRVNKRGWRDKDRNLENRSDSFRIVVLGDSMTFGYIVPKKRIYTWILEEIFQTNGFNVEVINISYSGWSTSQQLEALATEGLLYRPDLVLLHFVINDIDENLRYKDPGKFGNRIPFFHKLTNDGELVRRNNPRFDLEHDAITRKYILSKSEILKALWLVRQAWKFASQLPHSLRKSQISQIRHMLGEDLPREFMGDIKKYENQHFTEERLTKILSKYSLPDALKTIILRISENRPFQRGLVPAVENIPIDFSSRKWELFQALVKQMNQLCHEVGAKFAISSDHGPGRFRWARSWYHIRDNDQGRDYFNSINSELRKIAHTFGFDFIEPNKGGQRARNDSHLNIQGNEDQAHDLYTYIIERYGPQIMLHRF